MYLPNDEHYAWPWHKGEQKLIDRKKSVIFNPFRACFQAFVGMCLGEEEKREITTFNLLKLWIK